MTFEALSLWINVDWLIYFFQNDFGFFDRTAEAPMAQVSADRSIIQIQFLYKNQDFSIAHQAEVLFLKTSASDRDGQTTGALTIKYGKSAIIVDCAFFMLNNSNQYLNL